jgi:hypothetical protein
MLSVIELVVLSALMYRCTALERPPQIKSRLDKQTLLIPGAQHQFKLECKADERTDPPPQYVWYKADVELTNQETEGLEITGGTLWFKNPQPEHEGRYYCLAANSLGVAKSDVVHITQTYIEPPPGTVPPTFVKSPETEIKSIGGKAEFECSGEGEPKPKVIWYKNGKVIEKEIGNKLVISNVRKEDVANYACNITNIAGYEYKDVYLNILRQTAKIKQGPKEEKTVSKGSNVTMKCETEGYPKPAITWHFQNNLIVSNDKYVVNSANGDLVIRQVDQDDQGMYRCTASNSEDLNDSQEGQLNVKTKTTIVEGPTDMEATVFTNVRMNCTVMYDLSEDIVVTWMKDNREIGEIGYTEEDRIHQDANYALILKNITMTDAGDYTCVAKTSTSDDTDNGNLKVNGIPPTIVVAKPVETMEGGHIELACAVEGGFPKPTVEWFRDGDITGSLSNNDKYDLKEDNTLVIKNVIKDDSGVFRCRAKNDVGEDSFEVNVIVWSNTVITSETAYQEFEEGNDVVFNCNVEVDSELKKFLTVTWYKGNDELVGLKTVSDQVEGLESASYLSSETGFDLMHMEASGDHGNDDQNKCSVDGKGCEDEHMVLLKSKALKIFGITKEDLGEYRCEASLNKPGLVNLPVASKVSGKIYITSSFPWWIIVIAILVLLIIAILVCIVYRVKNRKNNKGYYDVSDIEATGKRHNKSDIYYMPEDADGDMDSIMNESDNFPLNASTPNKTPIFTPKTIRHLNNRETTAGSVGSLLEDDEFLRKGMDEDGSFRERYAE